MNLRKNTRRFWRTASLLGLALFVLSALSCNKDQSTYVEIETEYGTMKAKLYDSTPRHKENFIKLAEEGYYDGLLFHRVMNGFMIQGGDPDSRDASPGQRLGAGGPGYKLDAEFGAYHFKGALAAARQGDQVNPEKQSSGSQFYIVHGRPLTRERLDQVAQSKGITYSEEDIARYLEDGGTPTLDNEYTVFGELVEGFDVLDRIASQATDRANRPQKDIPMTVRVLK